MKTLTNIDFTITNHCHCFSEENNPNGLKNEPKSARKKLFQEKMKNPMPEIYQKYWSINTTAYHLKKRFQTYGLYIKRNSIYLKNDLYLQFHKTLHQLDPC